MRARSIKPRFFKNEDLAECSPLARILFIGLWCEADREGRLENRPKRMRAEILPYDDCNCAELLAELAARGFVELYQVAGTAYIQITNFKKHQVPHHKEVASLIPQPPQQVAQACVNVEPTLDQEQAKPAQACVNEVASCPTDSLFSDSPFLTAEEPTVPSVTPLRAVPREVIRLPLNTGADHVVTDEHAREYRELYPAADVDQELRNMRGWLLASPTRRKTKTGVFKFIHSWLADKQNNPRRAAPTARAGPDPIPKGMSGPLRLEEMKRGLVADRNSDGDAKALAAPFGERPGER